MNQQKMIHNNHRNDNDNNNDNNVKTFQWTNEKHTNFLRGMEADFVRNMLMKKSSYTNNNYQSSRLDRFVPDMSESTLDLHKSDRVSKTCNRQRGIPNRPYQKSHDQVVPQVKNKAGDKK